MESMHSGAAMARTWDRRRRGMTHCQQLDCHRKANGQIGKKRLILRVIIRCQPAGKAEISFECPKPSVAAKLSGRGARRIAAPNRFLPCRIGSCCPTRCASGPSASAWSACVGRNTTARRPPRAQFKRFSEKENLIAGARRRGMLVRGEEKRVMMYSVRPSGRRTWWSGRAMSETPSRRPTGRVRAATSATKARCAILDPVHGGAKRGARRPRSAQVWMSNGSRPSRDPPLTKQLTEIPSLTNSN